MPVKCSWPTCTSYAMDNGLCTSHNKYYGPEDLKGVSKPTQPAKPVKKARKPIKKQSDKMKLAMKELAKLVKKKLAEQPECELKMQGCEGRAVTCHHSKGRVGKQLLNYKNLMASCSHCNLIAEEKDAEAREKGIKKSQHKIQK
jgi:hypothetical protein